MSYGRCSRCGSLADRNADGYCPGCASNRSANGFGSSLHYGTCLKCGQRKSDLNSNDICGSCRSYYGF